MHFSGIRVAASQGHTSDFYSKLNPENNFEMIWINTPNFTYYYWILFWIWNVAEILRFNW